MRLFIAISVPEEIKDKIRGAQRRFYKKGMSASREFHITLRFFGEVNQIQVNNIIEKLKYINFKKFEILVDGVGFFGSGSRIRVIFLNVYSKELLDFISTVNKNIPDINPQHIKDTPHITLFRVKGKDIRKEDFVFDFKKEFLVKEFYLIESIPTKEGHKYKVLEKFGLS